MSDAPHTNEEFRNRIAEAVEHEILRCHPKSRQEILSKLVKHWSIHCFEKASSTMDLARDAVQRKGETEAGIEDALEAKQVQPEKVAKFLRPQAYIAREQTAGRGRNHRTWVSERDSGIYVTFVFFPDIQPERLAGLSLVVGLAIQRAVSAFGAATCLKWPNDVLVDLEGGLGFRKLAGVLVETSSKANRLEMVSVGIGLNLDSQPVAGEIGAIGLKEIAAVKIDYFRVFGGLFVSVIELCERFFIEGLAPFTAEWTERSHMNGRRVRFTESGAVQAGDAQTGSVLGIDSQGGLRIRRLEGTDSEIVIYSGEVQLV